MRVLKFIKRPSSKIFAAFLAGALVVAAVALAGALPGLPHFTWADETNPGAQSAPLPGLGPDTIPDMVSSVSPAVVRINTTEIREGAI